VWTWTWSGDPLPTPGAVDATASASSPPSAATPTVDAAPAQGTVELDTPDIIQTNSSAASATASATFAQVQSAGSDAGQDVVQVVSSSQGAGASAEAVQIRPRNINVITAGALDGLTQENAVNATASATVRLTVSQTAVRSSDEAAADAPASSTQTISSSQSATADAEAVQVNAANLNAVSSVAPSTADIGRVEQRNLVSAGAFAGATGTVAQVVSQSQAGEGPQDASALQISTSTQAATASAQASQTNVGNVNDVVIPEFGVSNPALSQSNTLTVGAVAANASSTRQTTTQASANSNTMVLLSLEADQQADVKQSGDAGAGQAQANRLNVAHWNGTVASSAPPADEQAAAVPPADERSAAVPPAVSAFRLNGVAAAEFGFVLPALKIGRTRARAGATQQGHRTPATRSRPLSSMPTSSSPTLVAASFLKRLPPATVEQRSTAQRAAARPSQDRSLVCPTCGSSSLFGAIEGAHGTGTAGVVAVLSRFRLFAPSGAGRVRHEAPALGLPVEITPLERPG
jgi:epidermal growth factor receptor substrate 15